MNIPPMVSRFFWGLPLSILLALSLSIGAPRSAQGYGAHPMDVEVDITLDQTTINGTPWHGMPSVMVAVPHIPLMGNLPSYAPSPILCVVTVDTGPACYGKQVGGKLDSNCVQSYDCEWPHVKIPEQTFAMVFLSHGAYLGNKFVDVAVFTQRRLREDDPERQQIDAVARAAAARLAPTTSRLETERRERPFQVFRLQDCAEGCRLRQSKVGVMLDP